MGLAAVKLPVAFSQPTPELKLNKRQKVGTA